MEPLIINLLNEQPEDVLEGMEKWLLTQFPGDKQPCKYIRCNALTGKIMKVLKTPIEETPEYKTRSAILDKKIPKKRINELKEEIAELE